MFQLLDHSTFIVRSDSKIKHVLEKLKKKGSKCLFVSNDKKKIIGSISDGDIRKVLLRKQNLNKTIVSVFNKKFKYLYDTNITLEKINFFFYKYRIDFIPVLNKNKTIKGLLDARKILAKRKKNKKKIIIRQTVPVVIMAGGYGVRLKPLTNILPKPLLTIKGITIIKRIIDIFNLEGFKKIYVSINNKSELLKSYISELKYKDKIKFIEESIPLGTVGSLSLLPKKHKDIFVCNCDVLHKINLSDLLIKHKKFKNDLTMIVSKKAYEIPYGVCEINKSDFLQSIKEKPKFEYFIYTGLFIVKRSIINLIPKQTKLDFNELIIKAKLKKLKIGVHKISNKNWFDTGQWSELKKTLDNFN